MFEVLLFANNMKLVLVCNILTPSSLLIVIDGHYYPSLPMIPVGDYFFSKWFSNKRDTPIKGN
jgi:hypothetical protein